MTTTADLYTRFSLPVRARLARLGVRTADLEDALHEVFLVVHRKHDATSAIEQPRLWLNAICRRVAVGYRRSASYRRELLARETELADLTEALEPAMGERQRPSEELRLLLARLDEHTSDLVALHHLGPLSVTEMAKFFAHDRKTLRKRLNAAQRRLMAVARESNGLVSRDPVASTSLFEPNASIMSAAVREGRAAGCSVRELEVLITSSGFKAGLIGNLLLVSWSALIAPSSLEHLTLLFPAITRRCGGAFVFVAIVEPTAVPPTLAGRRAIALAFNQAVPALQTCAICMLGGVEWFAEPILNAAMAFVRQPAPMRFFGQVEPMVEWLCQSQAFGPGGALSKADAMSALDQVRRLGSREIP